MSAAPVVARITLDTRRFERALRKMIHATKRLTWALNHAPITDDEALAFRWAIAHVRSGRTDLAVEDLAWLGRRLAS